jgi:murein DD-endopeptidase MepM/ murein hydrolase activator NlpD
MLSNRYTVVIADRASGVVRRFTVSLRPTLAIALGLFTLPVLVGLGARWSATAELDHLRQANAALRQENASFRDATGALTGQIAALQSTVTELGSHHDLDPATRRAMSKLPAIVRSQARGGAATPDPKTVVAATVRSPEDTFGLLKDVLGSLEHKLSVVRVDVEKQAELARATPSIWPALGWLTSGFGTRADPITGRPQSHLGLDISADKGQPVYATANGTVQSAGWHAEFGNLVVLEHAFGLTTRYAHLSRITARAGTEVARGDLIGYVGSTGRSTGTHLHYEVWANGRPVNPLRLLVGKPN